MDSKPGVTERVFDVLLDEDNMKLIIYLSAIVIGASLVVMAIGAYHGTGPVYNAIRPEIIETPATVMAIYDDGSLHVVSISGIHVIENSDKYSLDNIHSGDEIIIYYSKPVIGNTEIVGIIPENYTLSV